MISALKILRLLILVVAWYQIVAMLPVVTWIGNEVTAVMWVGLILKTIFAVVLFSVAFGFKKLISRIGRKKIAA